MNNLSNFSIFKQGSRTYFYSSLFFPPSIRTDVFKLYSFVRVADNFVDIKPPKKSEFKKFVNDYNKALQGEKVNNEIIVQFVQLSKKCGFDERWVNAFLDAMNSDLNKHRYQNLKELQDYMYGSAEVIGLMMAKILNLPKESFKGAQLLGRAMQYANFIRDIDEDLYLGRTYLPQQNLKKYGLTSLSHQDVTANPDSYKKFVDNQIQLFQRWQLQAEGNLKFIPYRYRIPVQTASDMYKWTVQQIAKNPFLVYEKKVKPSIPRILFTILKNSFILLPWKTLFVISRPRFWLYLAGPYLVGTALASNQISVFYSLSFWLHFLFFLIPANLFIYGINDLSDRDTDQFNPKKEKQENLLKDHQFRMLKDLVKNLFLLSLLFIALQPNIISALLFSVFLILSVAYSAKPFRLKARPFFDSTSNIFYLFPGVIAYTQLSNSLPPIWVFFAGACWTTAMHLFSAIPDITADKKANLTTTATELGDKVSFLTCTVLWTLCAATSSFFSQTWWTSLLLVYPVMPLLPLIAKMKVDKVYWYFPKLTAVLGFLFFWIIIFTKDLL